MCLVTLKDHTQGLLVHAMGSAAGGGNAFHSGLLRKSDFLVVGIGWAPTADLTWLIEELPDEVVWRVGG